MSEKALTVTLITLTIILPALIVEIQPLQTNIVTDSRLTQNVRNTKVDVNHDLPKENEGYVDASTLSEPTNQQGSTTTDNLEELLDTASDQNTHTNTPPPDGRIYWSPEPPYAYTPTCTPKEWTRIPIIPPATNN